MPEDLAQQIPYIRRALEAYRIPILELPGFEADDVIGTLAHKAADEGYSVFVVSSDKDMMQLVNERICVLNPPKDNLICDAAKVEEILGVPPERVVDVMALRGDCHRQHSRRARHRRQGFGGADPALRQRGERAGPRGGGRAQDLSRVAAEQSRCRPDEQGAGHDQDRSSRWTSSRRRCGRRSPMPAAARALFTELEFTTLVQDFLSESVELGETDYREAEERR